MKTALAVVVAILSIGARATAHRLDEYLQATLITVDKDRVQAQLRLIPGVAVVPFVLSLIDTNADGVISESEQRAYADRVIRDLSLTVDGDPIKPQLVSMKFPEIAEMKQGLGEIHLDFRSDLSRHGPKRRFILENRHQSRIAAYLVNCLAPDDPDIRVTAQRRNESQSVYQLDYAQGGSPSLAGWGSPQGWLGAAALLLFVRITLLWNGARKSMTFR